MASNPAFNRINKDIKAGIQDRPVLSSDPSAIQDLYDQRSASPWQRGRLSLDDVVMKTGALFTLLACCAAASWIATSSNAALMAPAAYGSMFAGLAIGLVIAFKKTISVPLIVCYSALEGVLVGALSAMFETAYPGIVTTAVIATGATFAGMFIGWKTGLIKVTSRARRIFGLALMGYLLFSVVNVIASFAGVGAGWGFGGNGPLGIGISILGVGMASYSLAIDFDTIEKAVAAELPEKYSWLLAHGLIVSLVWLYLEILRLLARARR